MKRLLLALLLLAAAAADAQIPGSPIAQSGGGVSSGGSGTVTSVGIAGTGGLTASPSPIVGAGTITLNAFTSGLPGGVLASGGGTTNFLRADGTWAAPGGGGATPTLYQSFPTTQTKVALPTSGGAAPQAQRLKLWGAG